MRSFDACQGDTAFVTFGDAVRARGVFSLSWDCSHILL